MQAPYTRKGERGTINIVNGTPPYERSRKDQQTPLGHWEGDLISGTKTHIATCRPKIMLYDHPRLRQKILSQ